MAILILVETEDRLQFNNAIRDFLTLYPNAEDLGFGNFRVTTEPLGSENDLVFVISGKNKTDEKKLQKVRLANPKADIFLFQESSEVRQLNSVTTSIVSISNLISTLLLLRLICTNGFVCLDYADMRDLFHDSSFMTISRYDNISDVSLEAEENLIGLGFFRLFNRDEDLTMRKFDSVLNMISDKYQTLDINIIDTMYIEDLHYLRGDYICKWYKGKNFVYQPYMI